MHDLIAVLSVLVVGVSLAAFGIYVAGVYARYARSLYEEREERDRA